MRVGYAIHVVTQHIEGHVAQVLLRNDIEQALGQSLVLCLVEELPETPRPCIDSCVLGARHLVRTLRKAPDEELPEEFTEQG